MIKPIVNIVSHQSESEMTEVNASQSEIDQLLGKYGYTQNHIVSQNTTSNGLSFEEMVAVEENKLKQEIANRTKPNSITIDPNTIKYHQSSYSNDSDLGFGFKITISSDMNI